MRIFIATQGRRLCYAVVYSLDATRCVILHLAAAQSLQRAAGGTLGLWTAGGIVAVIEIAVSQVRNADREPQFRATFSQKTEAMKIASSSVRPSSAGD